MKSFLAKKILWDEVPTKKQTELEQRVQFIQKFQFFESLSKSQLKEIEPLFFERSYAEGEFLFELDQPGAALFILEEGEVAIEISSGTNQFTQIAVLKAGSFIGEIALLDNSPRSANAKALKPVKALALFRTDLNKLVDSHPEIAVHIFRGLGKVVSERLKKTNELLHDQI